MNVSEIRVFSVNKGSLVGMATVTLDNGFIIDGVKIFNGSKGMFAGMPSKEYTNNAGEKKYTDIVSFTTQEQKFEFSNAVIAAYEAQAGGGRSTGARSTSAVPQEYREAAAATPAKGKGRKPAPAPAPVEDYDEDNIFDDLDL